MGIDSIARGNLGKGLFRVGIAALAITTSVWMYPELTDKNQKLVNESELKNYSEMHRKEMAEDINAAGNVLGYTMVLGMLAAGCAAGCSSIKYFRRDRYRKYR